MSKKKNDIYFDDCPIRRTMKGAEKRGRDLSEEELREVFEKAKEKGAIVGKNKPPNEIES